MKLFSGNGHNSNNGGKAENNRVSRKREKPKKKKSAGKVILIVLAVIALIIGGFALYLVISTEPPKVDPVTPPGAEDPVINSNDDEEYTGERYFFTLIVGEDQLESNTDTIMYVRYDAYEKKANLVSLPRDTMLNVSWKAKRINAVYYNSDNGIESLMDEVGSITGYRPNNYVIVNIQLFMDLVNAMGGVWFDVPCDMNYDDYATDNYGNPYEFTIHVEAGYQKLSGYDALGVFRFRQNNNGTGYGMGDLERIEVQHNLLFAIIKQAMETRNIVTLMEIANSVMGNCKTDLEIRNIQWYLTQLLKMDMEDISFFTMPTIGCWVNDVAYVTIDANAWVEMLNEHFNTAETPIEASNLPLLQAKDPNIDRYSLTPSNYYVTNGDAPYTNFPRGPKGTG